MNRKTGYTYISVSIIYSYFLDICTHIPSLASWAVKMSISTFYVQKDRVYGVNPIHIDIYVYKHISSSPDTHMYIYIYIHIHIYR